MGSQTQASTNTSLVPKQLLVEWENNLVNCLAIPFWFQYYETTVNPKNTEDFKGTGGLDYWIDL